MPRRHAADGYTVANPLEIPKGTPIITVDERDYFEGDAYDGLNAERLLKDGYLTGESGETEPDGDADEPREDE